VDGDGGGFADLVGGQAVAAELIGQSGRDEAVADDGLAGGEGRENDLRHHLGAGGHVEEHPQRMFISPLRD